MRLSGTTKSGCSLRFEFNVDDSDQKGQELAKAQFEDYLEFIGDVDDSGVLGKVLSLDGRRITVDNANHFRDDQTVKVGSRGKARILTVDASRNELVFHSELPEGTAAGDCLILNRG